jgi:hypothetical protein
MEWQPIETAPIGVDVLFHSIVPADGVTRYAGIADWAKIAIGQRQIKTDRKGCFVDVVSLFRVGNQLLKRATAAPTHWMPLPVPPHD